MFNLEKDFLPVPIQLLSQQLTIYRQTQKSQEKGFACSLSHVLFQKTFFAPPHPYIQRLNEFLQQEQNFISNADNQSPFKAIHLFHEIEEIQRLMRPKEGGDNGALMAIYQAIQWHVDYAKAKSKGVNYSAEQKLNVMDLAAELLAAYKPDTLIKLNLLVNLIENPQQANDNFCLAVINYPELLQLHALLNLPDTALVDNLIELFKASVLTAGTQFIVKQFNFQELGMMIEFMNQPETTQFDNYPGPLLHMLCFETPVDLVQKAWRILALYAFKRIPTSTLGQNLMIAERIEDELKHNRESLKILSWPNSLAPCHWQALNHYLHALEKPKKLQAILFPPEAYYGNYPFEILKVQCNLLKSHHLEELSCIEIDLVAMNDKKFQLFLDTIKSVTADKLTLCPFLLLALPDNRFQQLIEVMKGHLNIKALCLTASQERLRRPLQQYDGRTIKEASMAKLFSLLKLTTLSHLVINGSIFESIDGHIDAQFFNFLQQSPFSELTLGCGYFLNNKDKYLASFCDYLEQSNLETLTLLDFSNLFEQSVQKLATALRHSKITNLALSHLSPRHFNYLANYISASSLKSFTVMHGAGYQWQPHEIVPVCNVLKNSSIEALFLHDHPYLMGALFLKTESLKFTKLKQLDISGQYLQRIKLVSLKVLINNLKQIQLISLKIGSPNIHIMEDHFKEIISVLNPSSPQGKSLKTLDLTFDYPIGKENLSSELWFLLAEQLKNNSTLEQIKFAYPLSASVNLLLARNNFIAVLNQKAFDFDKARQAFLLLGKGLQTIEHPITPKELGYRQVLLDLIQKMASKFFDIGHIVDINALEACLTLLDEACKQVKYDTEFLNMLQQIKRDLQFELFYNNYNSAISLIDEKTPAHYRHCLFEELLPFLEAIDFPCLSIDQQKIIDGILCQAAGKHYRTGDTLDSATKQQLVQFVLLQHIANVTAINLKLDELSSHKFSTSSFVLQDFASINTGHLDELWKNILEQTSFCPLHTLYHLFARLLNIPVIAETLVHQLAESQQGLIKP